jgi:hypothetical protein
VNRLAIRSSDEREDEEHARELFTQYGYWPDQDRDAGPD